MRPLLRKLDGAGFACVFATAPHDAPAPPTRPDQPSYSWLALTSGGPSHLVDVPREYSGWEQSRALIADQWREGGFVGLLAFSQGSVCVHHLLNELAAARAGDAALADALAPLLTAPPRFVVLCSGFPSRAGSDGVFSPPRPLLSIPSVHASSTADEFVPADLQDALAAFFEAPIMLRHDKGHTMPQSSEHTRAIADFCSVSCS